jgi:hypothetical protein
MSFYLKGKIPQYSSTRRLVRLQSQFGCDVNREKFVPLSGIES